MTAPLFIPISAANQAVLQKLDAEAQLMAVRRASLLHAIIAQTVDPEAVKFHASEIKDGVIILTPPPIIGMVTDSPAAGTPAE